MAVKECSLYQYKTKGGGVINTTPKDITARRLASRVTHIANHGATRNIVIDLSIPRLLVIGHGNTAGLRGVYMILVDGTVIPSVPAANITASVTISDGVATLSVSNSTTTASNARFVVI